MATGIAITAGRRGFSPKRPSSGSVVTTAIEGMAGRRRVLGDTSPAASSGQPPKGDGTTAAGWRLTGRGRVALWVVFGISIVLGLGVSQVATAPDITSVPQQTLTLVPESQRTSSVVVRPGDSLWVIAERELGYMDPREAVVELRRINGVSGGELIAGQRLDLPVR